MTCDCLAPPPPKTHTPHPHTWNHVCHHKANKQPQAHERHAPRALHPTRACCSSGRAASQSAKLGGAPLPQPARPRGSPAVRPSRYAANAMSRQ
jgi:hypothetical protein